MFPSEKPCNTLCSGERAPNFERTSRFQLNQKPYEFSNACIHMCIYVWIALVCSVFCRTKASLSVLHQRMA